MCPLPQSLREAAFRAQTLPTRASRPLFCDYLSRPEDRGVNTGPQVLPRGCFPPGDTHGKWPHFHKCRWAPTKGGKSPISLGWSNPTPLVSSHRRDAPSHSQRCSPARTGAQSWLREVLIPVLSPRHSLSGSGKSQDPPHWHVPTVTGPGVPWVTPLIDFGVQRSTMGLCIRTGPGQTGWRSFFLPGRGVSKDLHHIWVHSGWQQRQEIRLDRL